ncbi:NtaA/DmoA family FMN-dependent monooxygenase [Parvibaculum sp.]|uniref:NtaA/DmoA family FMN-dependent monooxygenase n=1 Tax=Parvibaculum sp. TaxID=2024848 RepID=UPI002CEBDE77|nr:NtaA/DmoA family FMN-dependent monooxygenase [Parvibaculum sp.]HUD51457.1 NtaA/DmoA family FMN-dependent monooxygenase [Parvibaculum sp.]
MAKRFHLGWFTNFTADEWNTPFANGGSPWDGKFYVEIAQALERACFDYLMFEDKLSVSEAYGGTTEVYLKHALGMVPKHDPAPLAAVIGAATSHLGIVATMSTMAYPPFLLARLCSTIDHIAGGRFGWNIVTSAENAAAQNFGMDKLPPRELRYEMAHEYMDLVYRLFDSWEPDAVVMDRETGTYADFTKVHPVNFEGKYFKSRGPLNTVRSPQGRPTLVQAGGSPKGRDFAAKHADSIIALNSSLEEMKAFRDDVRARAEGHGRNPDDIKVLFLVAPVLGATEQDARDKHARMRSGSQFIEYSLALMSAITDIDFSKYELDKPLPERLVTNGEQGSLDAFQQWGSGKTLRELVQNSSGAIASIELIGTPDRVADKMGDAMATVGGDGFLITTPTQAISRRVINEVTEGLVPALQRRGLVRTEYTHKTLRENLRAF